MNCLISLNKHKFKIMKKLIVSKSRLIIVIGLLISIIGISESCTKSSMDNVTGTGSAGSKGSGGPGANEVWIQGMAFNPATITVSVGTTIMWTNKDAVTHNVSSNPVLFSSGSMSNGTTFSYKFATAGTFSYSCTIHPSMTASVTVNEIMPAPTGY
jgi:plastocyanin